MHKLFVKDRFLKENPKVLLTRMQALPFIDLNIREMISYFKFNKTHKFLFYLYNVYFW